MLVSGSAESRQKHSSLVSRARNKCWKLLVMYHWDTLIVSQCYCGGWLHAEYNNTILVEGAGISMESDIFVCSPREWVLFFVADIKEHWRWYFEVWAVKNVDLYVHDVINQDTIAGVLFHKHRNRTAWLVWCLYAGTDRRWMVESHYCKLSRQVGSFISWNDKNEGIISLKMRVNIFMP